VGGCIVFESIEVAAESELKHQIAAKKVEFLARHPGVEPQELEKLIDGILFRGISPLQKDLNSSTWSFGQSFLFTVTVVTTIGYGHIHPMTPDGKVACIVYALVGIPFTLIFLSALVQRLLGPTFAVLSAFTLRLPDLDNFQVRLLHLATIGGIFLILAVLLPSLVFFILEDQWSLLDATYFVFISITTIGLGDYIPGDSLSHVEYRDVYKTIVGLFLLLGLVLTSLTLTIFYDIPQLNLGLHLHRYKDIAEDKINPETLSITTAGNTSISALSSPASQRPRENMNGSK